MLKSARRRWQIILAAAFAASFATVAIWLQARGSLSDHASHSAPLAGASLFDGAASAAGLYHPVEAAGARATARTATELALPGGAGRLVIPAGAVARDTTFTAVEHRGLPPDAVVVDLQPDGLRLQRPARLEMLAPPGYTLEELEIAAFDRKSARWVREPQQGPGDDGDHLRAHITHLSLRRVRIRPGMNFPYDPSRARGTFFLESDPGNFYEKLIGGRWQIVGRQTAAYRELVKMGRTRRTDLIASGRLRAVAGPAPGQAPLSDSLRQVQLPAGALEARTGWVRVTRLGTDGAKTGFTTIARVIPLSDDLVERDGPVVRMSRAVVEALGLTWGVDFGVFGPDGERTTIHFPASGAASERRFIPVALEPWTPAPTGGDRTR